MLVQNQVPVSKQDSTDESKEEKATHIAKESGSGTLCLTTDPWVDVFIDGKRIGQAPLVDIDVAAGNIKMHAVNKEAGIDRFFFVRIRKDKRTTKRFNFF